MTVSNTVGGLGILIAIAGADQHGNAFVVVPDAPPTWSNNAALEALSFTDATQLHATAKALAEGSDSVAVSFQVGGKSFTASLSVPVLPEVLVLHTVSLVATPVT